MGTQRGRNSGLTGLLDLPGLGAKFEVRLYRWQPRLNGGTRPRRGRGGGVFRTVRWMFSAGSIVCSGEPRLDGWPAPDAWKGQAGTIKVTVHTNKTVTYPVLVVEHGFGFDEKSQELPDVHLACEITGPAVYDGWGTGAQPAATDPVKADQQQWEGTQFTSDPQGLLDNVTVVIDWWGPVADTDAAEATKLNDVITAAAPPIPGLKKRPGTITRDAVDGGTITLVYGRTDTEEDVVNPLTQTKIDPEGLGSLATAAAVNATPAVPAGLVSRGETTRELNDDKTLHSIEAGTRSTRDDVEMPETFTDADPAAIKSSAQDTAVFETVDGPPADAGAPLAELQVVGTHVEELDRVRSKKTTKFSVLNSEQEIAFPKISTGDDPNNVEDDAVRVAFWDAGDTPPAAPDDPPTNNVKLLGKTDVPVTPQRNLRVWAYGARDSRDRLVLPNYETADDPSGLSGSAVRAALDGEAITDPAGYVVRGVKTVPVTLGLGTNRVLTVKVYGVRTTQQDVEFLKSESTAEAGALEQKVVVARVTDDGTPDATGLNPDAANLSLYWSQSHQETASGKWVHVYEFRPLTPTEAMAAEFEGDAIDPASLEDEHTRVLFGATGVPAADPGIAGQVLVGTTVKRVGKAKYRYVYKYGYRTSAQKLEAEQTTTAIDPADLDSEDVTATVYTGAAPADPAPPAGLKLVLKTDRTTPNPAYTLRVYRWGKQTSRDKLEQGNTFVLTDPNGIESRAQTAKVDDPTPGLPAGFKSLGVKSQPLNDGHTLYTEEGGLQDSRDKHEQGDGTFLEVDAAGLDTKGRHTTVFSGAEPTDAGITEATGDVQIVNRTVLTLNDGTKKKVWALGTRTSQNAIEWAGTFTATDPDALASAAGVVQVAPTTAPPAVPAAPLPELQHVLRTVRQHTLSKSVFEDRYDVLTAVQKLLYQHARATADPLGVYKSWVPSIVNHAGDEKVLAESVRDAHGDDITFDGCEVLRIDPGRCLQIVTYTGEDNRIHSETSRTFQDSVRGTPTGAWGTTGAQMLVSIDGVSTDAGAHWTGYATFQDQKIWRTTGSFSLRRRLLVDIVDTDADTIPDAPDLAAVRKLALVGTTNNAPFMGHPAHRCIYTGASLVYCRKLLTKHLVVVDFNFDTDDREFFNDGLLFGSRFAVTNLATTNPGLIAANLIWPAAAITWPAAAAWTFDAAVP